MEIEFAEIVQDSPDEPLHLNIWVGGVCRSFLVEDIVAKMVDKFVVEKEELLAAESLLSKALGHLHSCSCQGSQSLYQEIASAFGESGLTKRAPDAAKWSGHYETCPAKDGLTCTCGY